MDSGKTSPPSSIVSNQRNRDAINLLWHRFSRRAVNEATRLIRSLRIDEIQFDAESAADIAFFNICRARNHHKLDALEDGGDFWNVLFVTLQRVILDERDRSRAAKRRGGRASPAARAGPRQNGFGAGPETPRSCRRIDADLDRFISRQPPVEDVVLINADFEALLDLMPDPRDRTILAMRCRWFRPGRRK